MRKFFIITPLGLIFAAIFFFLLGKLIGVNKQAHYEHSEQVHLTLTQINHESLQTRQRRKSPPQPPKMAKMPMVPTPTTGKPDAAPTAQALALDIPTPNADIQTNIKINAQIGTLNGVQVKMGVDSNPVILARIPPRYPQRALRRSIEGSVTVQFIVQRDGHVKPGSIQIVKANPKHIFDNAVKEAIYGWKLQPKKRNGKAITFRAEQTIRFSLGDR
ncbi:energy transducer TonB [Celerinatantimonas diazotrophica]|uniref:Protein TonB n=1 Tax=Celerinatantimonas diazotrophica TaxID=412034 RepID=A0A4R1JNU3_9GAMM|nr:energy transducer TonB [Celerinatantimonas diazotrophica]TCK52189.1 outer membrane transport energization protein TonB [Celerinatantimonas diazotrophica]CAG9296106.1 hypothetical protein CEDIAZO_01249 [Celerinatantimonas diazotrophica]